jgi:hypothetical protein
VRVRISKDSIAVDLTVVERIFAVKRSFSIPISNIIKVSSELPAPSWKEIKLPGTWFPGVVKYGSYNIGRERSFWLVRKGRHILNIEVKGMSYKRFVLEVENNEELIRTIKTQCCQN